jgi:hypothetical protein
MNYATNRLDRAARSRDGLRGLAADFQQGLHVKNHTLIANTLLQIGWNQHAVFHAALVWQEEPGDYAQLCEFAGYPEIGALALLIYSCNPKTTEKVSIRIQQSANDSTDMDVAFPVAWLDSAPTPSMGHCGCGMQECGASRCPVAMSEADIDFVCDKLQHYVAATIATINRTVPTAHELLGCMQKNLPLPDASHVPLQLQFWNSPRLSPVLKLLLVKLLYLWIPSLACEAIVRIPLDACVRADLVADYKSHVAYYDLVRAMVLGQRLKPARRYAVDYYHVPVWALLRGHDRRCDYYKQSDKQMQLLPTTNPGSNSNNQQSRDAYIHDKTTLVERLRMLLQQASTINDGHVDQPTLTVCLPRRNMDDAHNPIYIVGDSHALSLAWQTIRLPTGELRMVVPVVVTGLKAWHCRAATRFFTKSNLDILLQRLECLRATTLLFSAGEIDCREGFGGPLLEGYNDSNGTEYVAHTVNEYVDALEQLVTASATLQQILVLPVPPHAEKRSSRKTAQIARLRTIRVWNDTLRQVLPRRADRVFLLDYVKELYTSGDESCGLKRALDADSTHMTAAFARHLEEALCKCNCALEYL